MSRHSAKTAGRSAGSAAGTAKKETKTRRNGAKTAAKSGRRPAGKATRAVPKPASKRSATKNAPPKSAPAKSAPKVARKIEAKSVPITPAAPPPMMHTPSPPMQPAAPTVPVGGHRYRVGETVYYTSPTFGRAAATGSYTVVKLLPSEGDDYQYRIKSSGEAFERVAKESQLDKA
jgi:hypothetical protein